MMSTVTLAQPLTPVSFQARWPDRLNPEFKSLCVKASQVFWKILSILIFPIFLLQCLASSLRRVIYNNFVIPGSPYQRAACKELYENIHEKHQTFPIQKVSLSSPDGIQLDGIFIPNRITDKVIIYGFGNGEQWETVDIYTLQLLRLSGAGLLLVNPRNIGQSHRETPDEEGLSLDMWSAYDFLIREKGIDPNHILAIGQSMGGALTTLGAALAQEQYPEKKIKAINLRSFSKLSNEIYELLGRGSFASFASQFIWLIGGELDSVSAFKKLRGEKKIFWVKADCIIPYPAQMHAAMHETVPSHEIFEKIGSNLPHHNSPLIGKDATALLLEIQRMLDLPPIPEDAQN